MNVPSLNQTIAMRLVLFLLTPALCAQPPNNASAETKPLQWVMQVSGVTASLRGIYAVDDKTAWASGTAGTVLKTTDGGSHWTPCTTPPDAQKLDFRGIQAWDTSLAIVMSSGPGDQSRIFKTTDGCKTWTLAFKNPDSPDGFFDSFFANWSEDTGSPTWTGSILGDPAHGHFILYDTIDSGATWTPRKAPDLPTTEPSLGGFAASNSLFPANQEGLHSGNIFASGGKGGAILWIQKPSAGKSPRTDWQKISLPLAHGTDATGIFSIASHSEKDPFRNVISSTETLVAVGGDYSKPNESTGTAAGSTNSGINWTAATKPPHGYRSSVAWSDKLNAWIAVGTNGSDISHDDGKTWQPLEDSIMANENWNAISLPFVVGPKGRIARLSASAPQFTH